MNLYHVTRENLAENIWSRGVHPEYATGKMPVTWWVDEDTIFWAMAHVSARWSLAVDRLIVVESDITGEFLTRWARPGIYYCRVPVMVGKLWGYEHFIKPEV